MSSLLVGLGFGVGVILGIAALSGMFMIADRLRKRAQRRRILTAAAKCRWCDYAGGLPEVAVHEALDHHHEGSP